MCHVSCIFQFVNMLISDVYHLPFQSEEIDFVAYSLLMEILMTPVFMTQRAIDHRAFEKKSYLPLDF